MTGITFVQPYGLLGGAERYLEDILTRIDRSRVDRVIALQDGPFLERLRELGFDTELIPTSASRVDMARSALRLRRLLGAKPTVVHANGLKAALIAGLATVGRTQPIVWVKHDFSWDGALARIAARRCHTVVAVTDAVASSVRHARVVVIPPGVRVRDVDRIASRHSLAAELALPHDAFVISLVGRLHPVKGHHELLAALPEITSRRRDVVVLFVGGTEPMNPGYAEGVATASAGAPARVELLGHRLDAIDIIAASDVLVAPSVRDDRGMGREGAGIALLEAMSVGTPVVAYDD
ncbi:MAG: hypothetical protein V7636_133, partial [Actinomycetota bacterium]